MELLRSLAAALAVGVLIGIERGWRQREAAGWQPGQRFAHLWPARSCRRPCQPYARKPCGGNRAGGHCQPGSWISQRTSPRNLYITNTLVGIITFALGYMAGQGLVSETLAVAAVTTLILTLRQQSHAMLKGMSHKEVRSIATFAIVALVILPLLRMRATACPRTWNRRQIWMVVVVVLSFSFAGYVASRRLGADKGVMIAALFGALVSSTAVTVAYARRLRANDGPQGPLIAGIALASLVMFARVRYSLLPSSPTPAHRSRLQWFRLSSSAV